MVDVAALLLGREVVDPLLLLGGAEGAEREDLRLAAGEQRGAVRAGRDADLGRDRADLLRAPPVRTALVDGDLLADEVLVDRVGGLLDVAARDSVCGMLLALGACREGQLELLLDAGEKNVALARLELLRVLLGVRERAQLALELRPDGTLDRPQPLRLEQHAEPVAHLRLADDVALARVHRDRRRVGGEQLVDDPGRVAEPDLGDPPRDALSVPGVELGVQLDVDPLLLADLARELVDRVADPDDLRVREGERLEQRLLGHLVAAGLDHRERVAGADDDQVERRLVHLLVGRVDEELTLDAADPHGADRAEERQRRDRERGRGPVDREDVVRDDHVGREHGADDLHLVLEALRPQRPDRTVDHPRRERRALGGAPLALEESARDLAGGVHPLLDVDRQGKEVRVGAGVLPPDSRCEDHRVPAANDDRAARLLRELARLEAQLVRADVDGHRGLLPGVDGAHTVSCPSTLPLWRKVEV